MEDLNKRLGKQLTCIPFRPNVMVEGTEPFDEVRFYCWFVTINETISTLVRSSISLNISI
jgi:uncharacterized protein YcbX